MTDHNSHSGLPPFPTDEGTLSSLEYALQLDLSFEEADGGSPDNPVLIGPDGQKAEFHLSDLLEFMSGTREPGTPEETYRINQNGERMTEEEIAQADALGEDQYWMDARPHYCLCDAIFSLIAEVRAYRKTEIRITSELGERRRVQIKHDGIVVFSGIELDVNERGY